MKVRLTKERVLKGPYHNLFDDLTVMSLKLLSNQRTLAYTVGKGKYNCLADFLID